MWGARSAAGTVVLGLLAALGPVIVDAPVEAAGAAATAPTVAARPTLAATTAPATSPVSEFQPFVRWGGRVVAVDISAFPNPTGGNNDIVAALDSGGLLKSTDAGNTWQPLADVGPIRMNDVRSSPRQANLLVATSKDDTRDAGGMNSGIARSTDGGATWTQPASGAFTCNARARAWGIAFAPDSDDVFAGTDCGLAVSHDRGATWKNVVPTTTGETAPSNKAVYSVIAQAGGIVDVCGEMGLRRSTNKGDDSWKITSSAVGKCIFGGRPSVHALAASPFDANTLFVGVDAKSAREVDITSSTTTVRTINLTDAGDGSKPPWVRTHKTSVSGQFAVYVSNTVDTFRNASCSSTTTPRCTNSFTQVATDHADTSDLAWRPDSNCPTLLAGDGGLLRTSDCGATFPTPIGSGFFNGLQIYEVTGQIHAGDHTDLYIGTQDNNLWASSNSGISWPYTISAEGFYIQIPRTSQNDFDQDMTFNLCSSCNNTRSKAHFASAVRWNEPVKADSTTGAQSFNPFIAAPKTFFELAQTSKSPTSYQLWLTKDVGTTWSRVSVSPGDIPAPAPGKLFVAGSATAPVLYQAVGRADGTRGLVRVTGALTATSTAPAQLKRADVSGLTNLGVSCLGQFLCQNVIPLGIDPGNTNHLLAADIGSSTVTAGMRESFDGGATWGTDSQLTSRVTDNGRLLFDQGGVIGTQVKTIAFDPVNPKRIWVGTEQAGIIVSFDGGVTWSTIEGSERIPVVSSFFFDDLLNRVVVSSYGRGLWKLPRTDGLQFTVNGVPANVPVTAVDETTGARTTLRADSDGRHRGIELAGFPNLTTVAYHFEVGGAVTPRSSHTLTTSERSLGVAALTGTILHHGLALNAPPAITPGVPQNLVATYESTFGGGSIGDPTIAFTLPGSGTVFRASWSLDFDTMCISPAGAGAACGERGFGAALANAYFTLDLDHSTTTSSGNVRTVTWAMTFKDAAASHAYNVVTSASDASGAGLPWDPLTTVVGITHPPTVGPFSPAGGFVPPGVDITLTAVYNDPDGAADLSSVSLTLTGGTGLTFGVASHTMRAGDQPLFSLGCNVGQAGSVVTTATVRIDCGASSFTVSGTTLTVNWRVRFAAGLSGRNYPVALQAADVARGSAGPFSAWSFAVDQPPVFSGFSPASGSQLPEVGQTFRATFTDADLDPNLETGTLRLIAPTGLKTFQSVELYWIQSSSTIAIANNGSKTLLKCTPGSTTTLDTTLARLNCGSSASTAVTNGAGQIVGHTISWNITPHTAMSGLTYTSSLSIGDDAQVVTGPTNVGSYTVNRDPSSGVNDPANGSSAPGQVVRFTTVCSDPDGWHRLQTIDFRLAKGQGNGPLALWVQLDEQTGNLRMYDPDTGRWSEGTPGSNVVLSTRFALLRLAGSSVVGSGPTGPSVRVTWEVVLRDPASRPNWQQQLRITDDTGASTGFDNVGRWTVR